LEITKDIQDAIEASFWTTNKPQNESNYFRAERQGHIFDEVEIKANE
jgi:hypothetical protein